MSQFDPGRSTDKYILISPNSIIISMPQMSAKNNAILMLTFFSCFLVFTTLVNVICFGGGKGGGGGGKIDGEAALFSGIIAGLLAKASTVVLGKGGGTGISELGNIGVRTFALHFDDKQFLGVLL